MKRIRETTENEPEKVAKIGIVINARLIQGKNNLERVPEQMYFHNTYRTYLPSFAEYSTDLRQFYFCNYYGMSLGSAGYNSKRPTFTFGQDTWDCTNLPSVLIDIIEDYLRDTKRQYFYPLIPPWTDFEAHREYFRDISSFLQGVCGWQRIFYDTDHLDLRVPSRIKGGSRVFECPFCVTKWNKNHQPSKRAKACLHKHGVNTGTRAPHCNKTFPRMIFREFYLVDE